MKIGELAERVGLKVETIRFYEKEGLLCSPHRSTGNYRIYSEHHAEDLAFVVFCRAIDIPLVEIKSLLRLKHSPEESCEPVTHAIDQKLLEIDQRINQLKTLRTQLRSIREKCNGRNLIQNCGIINQ